jgi:pimeloyl-ACP methyl ester carboxylesterase
VNLNSLIQRIFWLGVFALGTLVSTGANAQSYSGYVNLDNGHSLYVEYQAPSDGKETLILINGLTNEADTWQLFVDAMAPSGYGILRYDAYGMGETLAKSGPITSVIPMDSQVEDLNEMTLKLGMTGPLNLLGHSYGGGMAIAFAGRHPDRVKTAILLCPYTEPLAGPDQIIKEQVAATRLANPFNPASDEDLYNFFLYQDSMTIFPEADPSILISPLKPQAVFELTEGIRKYDMHAASKFFPANSVHLIIAGSDEYIAADVLNRFWSQLPPASRASRMTIQDSPHRVAQVYPVILAKWVTEIMDRNPETLGAHSFQSNPLTNDISETR